jgi:hypothetical protein
MVKMNKKMMRASAAFGLAIAMSLAGCARLPTVVPLKNAKAGEYTYYALPRTVLVVSTKGTVTTINDKAKCIDSEYDGLRKRLGLQKSKYAESVFSIAEVTVSTRVEADPERVYAVELSRPGTNAVGLKSSPRGLPSAASAASTDAVIPPLTAGLGLIASIVGKVFFGAPAVKSSTDEQDPCVQAAVTLEDLREALTALHKTEGAADSKEVLEYKAAKLEVAIKTIEGWFTGVELGKPKSIVCEVRPVTGTNEYPLFTYTMGAGIDLAQPQNCDLSAEFTAKGKAADTNDQATTAKLTQVHALSLSVTPVTTSLASTLATKPAQTENERSFYYRVPGYAVVLAKDGQTRLTAATELPIAQLGTEMSLPRLSAGGSVELAIGFDPDTGALIELSVKRQSADIAGQLSKLSDSAGGLIDASKADAGKNQELLELQEQQAILEARVAIKAAEEALAQ